MKTLCKPPLFVLFVLVCGCPKQTPAADLPSEPTEIEATSPEGQLERDCYDGDPEACDQLGH